MTDPWDDEEDEEEERRREEEEEEGRVRRHMTRRTAIQLAIVAGQALMAGLATVGVFGLAFAVLTWHLGYTWISMPPEGGCWP